MRIALVIYGSLEILSGGYLYDRKMVEALNRHGHIVKTFSLPWRSWVQHLADNVRLDFADTILAWQPDVILQDELNHPSLAWLNHRLKRRGSAPIISIVHHLRANEEHPTSLLPLYRVVEAAYLRTIDGFIWNSQTTRHNVLSLRGMSADGVVAYPSVADWAMKGYSLLHEESQQDTSLSRLIFIGNLIPRKRLDVLLHALQNAPRSLSLDVVGSEESDPQHAAEMRSLARALQVETRVHFHGKLSDDALIDLARQADLLVVPSFEGFGIVYLEAMALGLPVIASRAGAAGEIVRDGENGYLVPLGNAAEITRLLHLLHNDTDKLNALRAGARATFSRFPSWHESGEAIANWLEQFVPSWRKNHAKPDHTKRNPA